MDILPAGFSQLLAYCYQILYCSTRIVSHLIVYI